MAEKNVQIKFRNPEGGYDDIFPKTKEELVDGLSASLDGKVDKESGKGLSTEDYTTIEKNKLAGVEAGANNYTHPAAHSADMITDSTTKKIMTAQERIQLAGLVTSVYKYIHPDSQNPDNVTLGATGGLIKAQTNTSYTTAQLRNVILSPNAANVSAMQNGDIWIQYE